jgi:hypothetical protein
MSRCFCNYKSVKRRWFSEFRNDPNDNHMVFLFADHCVRLFHAYGNH